MSNRSALATVTLGLVLVVGRSGVAQGQSETAKQLARFLPGPISGLSDLPPPWLPPPSPAEAAWIGSPGCSLNASLGDNCVGWVTEQVAEQYFVLDSTLVRQMLALQPKIQAAQDRMMEGFRDGRMPTPAEQAEVGRLTHRQDSLKREARFVTLSIKVNIPPQVVALGDSLVGAFQGHPFYRRPWTGNSGATLSVLLAPAGFVLAPRPDQRSRADVKCVLVTVDFGQRDEARARALLQSVNYSALSGMIKL